MKCDICGMPDVLPKPSSFNLLFVWKFKMYRQITFKEFHTELWKTNLNKFAKTKSRKGEHNLLKMKKDSRKNVQKNLKLAIKIVGYHWTKNEVFHWGFLHILCSVCFTSFIIFVLKTTNMYFNLTYYYYTNLYVFLLWLNFQRNKTNKH